MYRREGGVPNRAELRSPTESPPDWDLQNLFNLDFTSSFPAPCLKESLVQTPVKMQPNKIVQTTSAIGSPAWMEEEIKPFNSVLETLRELGLPDGISLENFTSDRGLNTPPPLPELSDLNDCITPEGKLEYLGFGESFVEKEDRRGYSPINDTSSPLLDPNIENTVNLRDLFPLQNLGTESVGILNTQSSYLFEDSKQTLENQKPDYNHQQVIYEEPYKPVTTEQFDEGETSFVYLPSVCLEEPIEEQIIEVKPSVYEPITFENDDSSAEIITISVEEFNRLAGDLDLIQEANLIQEPGRSLIGTLPVSQAKALPIEPVYQLKTSQSSVPVVKQQADKRQSARTSGSEDDRKSSSSGSGSKKRRIASLDKDSEEYRDKRARNNESVRKSRDKAKHRQEETETRLDILSSENRRLQDKVDSLEKELSILRGLFSSSSTSNTIV